MQPIRFRLALAALGLALAAPAGAQEAPAADTPDATGTTTPAAPATGETQPAPDADTGADTGATPAEGGAAAPAAEGQPAPEGQAAPGGQTGAADPAAPEVMEIVKDTFGDWQVRCAPDGLECFMYQLALDAEKNPVAEVSILKLPEAADADAGVTIVSPLGTLLTTGVVVQIDTGERRQYPFAWCSQVGCFARFGLDTPSLSALKRGNAGKITLVSVGKPEDPVTLDMSLTGFTAAFDSLTAPAAPAVAPAAPAPARLPDLTGPAQN